MAKTWRRSRSAYPVLSLIPVVRLVRWPLAQSSNRFSQSNTSHATQVASHSSSYRTFACVGSLAGSMFKSTPRLSRPTSFIRQTTRRPTSRMCGLIIRVAMIGASMGCCPTLAWRPQYVWQSPGPCQSKPLKAGWHDNVTDDNGRRMAESGWRARHA